MQYVHADILRFLALLWLRYVQAAMAKSHAVGHLLG
jgi:hypothetical protein